MARYYRHKLPPWANKCIIIVERVTLPLLIFQAIRTLFFPTTFDVLLTAILAWLFISFYLKWI